jgi:hypothetical protein
LRPAGRLKGPIGAPGNRQKFFGSFFKKELLAFLSVSFSQARLFLMLNATKMIYTCFMIVRSTTPYLRTESRM